MKPTARRLPTPSALVILAVLVIPAAKPTPTAAQELGLFLGQGFSDFRHMESPTSIALHAQLPLPGLSFLRITGGYRRRWENERRPGTTCDFYWPGFEGCLQEAIDHDARLDQWELGVVLGIGVADDLEVRAGVVRVRNDLEASSRGIETGRSAGNVYPDGDVWGTALLGEAVWWSLAGGRLGVSARVRAETLDFGPCPLDVGAPFCGAERLLTVEIGLLGRGDVP